MCLFLVIVSKYASHIPTFVPHSGGTVHRVEAVVGAEATDFANDIDPWSMERYRGGDSVANERVQFQ
jgi:hypothetical protein